MHDYLNPKWINTTRVHDWRNYISDDLRDIWDTFTDKQKEIIAKNADDQASNEHWE
jgi:hypothetical protein